MAKGFVLGGVFTLRLLEAEEHKEAKGQVGDDMRA